MTDRDYQMVMLGMLISDFVILTIWWVLGRADRRADRRAATVAQAEAQAALDRVSAIAKAPARSDFNRYANAQDDGWDQALDSVRAAVDGTEAEADR